MGANNKRTRILTKFNTQTTYNFKLVLIRKEI